jgi:hypothetical protein
MQWTARVQMGGCYRGRSSVDSVDRLWCCAFVSISGPGVASGMQTWRWLCRGEKNAGGIVDVEGASAAARASADITGVEASL